MTFPDHFLCFYAHASVVRNRNRHALFGKDRCSPGTEDVIGTAIKESRAVGQNGDQIRNTFDVDAARECRIRFAAANVANSAGVNDPIGLNAL